MCVLHDDISAGKRCVVGEIVADGADASSSHALMDPCRHIGHLSKTNTLSPAREVGIVLMDATMTDASPLNGQMICK